MNRKKQKIINDTVLGDLLPRRNEEYLQSYEHENDHAYHYLGFIIEHVMDKLDETANANCLRPQYTALMLAKIFQFIQRYEFKEYKPMLKPMSLPMTLNVSTKYLIKLMEKAKSAGNLSGRGGTEHW